ncbi:MAG: hypothetical protein CM1200mP28_07140 [Deltaproteobacteria bacterium]|nr:MAG: hypothetical protein CM1200mP28_07140 [Deltaproteobacteria bacterium]
MEIPHDTRISIGRKCCSHLRTEPPSEQRIIKVSGPYTIRNSDFSFKEPYVGLEEIPPAGTVIANDGEIEVKTLTITAYL